MLHRDSALRHRCQIPYPNSSATPGARDKMVSVRREHQTQDVARRRWQAGLWFEAGDGPKFQYTAIRPVAPGAANEKRAITRKGERLCIEPQPEGKLTASDRPPRVCFSRPEYELLASRRHPTAVRR